MLFGYYESDEGNERSGTTINALTDLSKCQSVDKGQFRRLLICKCVTTDQAENRVWCTLFRDDDELKF